MVFDFLFITYFLYFFLSWASSLWILSSAISASTLYNHVLACLPTGLLNSTLYSILFFTQSSSIFLITCSYHLSLPTTFNDSCDMFNSNQLSQFFTCPSDFHGNITHPSNHMLYISVSYIYTLCVLMEGIDLCCMSVSVDNNNNNNNIKRFSSY